jgi:hypothetical protein
MSRAEIEKRVGPIIRECLGKFRESSRPGIPSEESRAATAVALRSDVRPGSFLGATVQGAAGDRLEEKELESGPGPALSDGLVQTKLLRGGCRPGRNNFDRPEF